MMVSERVSRVCVVIVNYRTAGLTVDCLRSLVGEREALGERMSVIVTDGASGDGSVERIRKAVEENGWGGWVRVMPLGRNGGFAYGNNESVREILKGEDVPEYVHLLNPDTVVRPGGVRELVEFMDGHPRVGVVGSRLEFADGRVQASPFRFHSVWGEINEGMRLGVVTRALSKYVVAPEPPGEACGVDWVSGASFLVRTEVFRAIGLLDERYFMYYEEADFCLRAARAGWERWYVPASRVVHLQGQATGGPGGKRVPGYWFDSRRWYFVKNHGRFVAGVADAAYVASYALWRGRRWVQGKVDTDPPGFLGDLVRNSVFVKGFEEKSEGRSQKAEVGRPSPQPYPGVPGEGEKARWVAGPIVQTGEDTAGQAGHGTMREDRASNVERAALSGDVGTRIASEACHPEGGEEGRRAVVGIVVIGRNEGERLVRCLRSVVGRAGAVVYVDSGSTDGSVGRAREMGAVVVELDMTRPFTAARARNEGLEALVRVCPQVEYVQFVDGDCEISAGWLEVAGRELGARPDFAVVCGRLRELNRNATWYNRLCDIERDLPAGEASECGGIAMMRVGPVREVGGFDASLIAGEEPELCQRLRKRGWRVWRSEADMGWHDAAMTKFGQWWKRMKRPGHAHCVGLEMYGSREGAHHLKEIRSVWFWAVGVPAMAVGMAWPTGGWSLLLLAVYPLQVARIWWRARRRQRLSGTDATVFAVSCVLAKWPALVGQLEYHRLKRQGKRAGIIEYKGADEAKKDGGQCPPYRAATVTR